MATFKFTDLTGVLKTAAEWYDRTANASGKVVSSTTAMVDKFSSATGVLEKSTKARQEYNEALKKTNTSNIAALKSTRDLQLEQLKTLKTSRDDALADTASLRKVRPTAAAESAKVAAEIGREIKRIEGEVKESDLLIGSAENRLALIRAGVKVLEASVVVELISKAIGASNQFNRLLSSGNVSLEERNRLFRTALETQVQLGVSLETVASAQNALRERGELYLDSTNIGLQNIAASGNRMVGSFQDAVAASSQLAETFGATQDQISETIKAAQNIGVSERDVGDEISNIVDRTSLTFTEALHTVTEISKLVRGYGFNLAKPKLNEIVNSVVGLEDALRRVGGDGGLATKIYKNITDLSTRTGRLALLFGGGPDAARNGKQFSLATQNITNFLKQFSGPGLGSQLVFQQLAESFGLTVDEARELIDAQKSAAKSAASLSEHSLTLQERFDQQAADAGRNWSMLKTQLLSLSNLALAPLVSLFQELNTVMIKAQDRLGKFLGGGEEGQQKAEVVIGYGASAVALSALAITAKRVVSGFSGLLRSVPSVLRGLTGTGEAISTASANGATALETATAATAETAAATEGAGVAISAFGGVVTLTAAGVAALVAAMAIGSYAVYKFATALGIGKIGEKLADLYNGADDLNKAYKKLADDKAESILYGKSSSGQMFDASIAADAFEKSTTARWADLMDQLKDPRSGLTNDSAYDLMQDDVENLKGRIKIQEVQLNTDTETGVSAPQLYRDREGLAALEAALNKLIKLQETDLQMSNRNAQIAQDNADKRQKRAEKYATARAGQLYDSGNEPFYPTPP